MTMFPLAPDQTIAQMWSNGVWGGGNVLSLHRELSDLAASQDDTGHNLRAVILFW